MRTYVPVHMCIGRCLKLVSWYSEIWLIHHSLLKSFVDRPSQYAAFWINSCTKLVEDKRVWRIKRLQIAENSLYVQREGSKPITCVVFSPLCHFVFFAEGLLFFSITSI